LEKFLAIWDTHIGFERKNKNLVPLHDSKAIKAMLAFAKDFKPDTVVLGGDILDCGAISHWNDNKPGATEGMRLAKDAQVARDLLVKPLEATMSKGKVKKIFIGGNHEAWIDDLLEKQPGLEGLIDPATLLGLNDSWKILPQGEIYRLSPHLVVCHGDQVKGGEHVAKAAVTNFQTSIRFGHHHTYQAYTATSPIYQELPRTGVAVPCLCTKDQKYGEGRPNKWAQGFLYGYIHSDGTFHDSVAIIVNGKTTINGKTYCGNSN
jgi:predicted phosphodiesterase